MADIFDPPPGDGEDFPPLETSADWAGKPAAQQAGTIVAESAEQQDATIGVPTVTHSFGADYTPAAPSPGPGDRIPDELGAATRWRSAFGESTLADAADLREAVYTAVGYASRCWEGPAGTGTFDEASASRVAEELLARFDDEVQTRLAGEVETAVGTELLRMDLVRILLQTGTAPESVPVRLPLLEAAVRGTAPPAPPDSAYDLAKRERVRITGWLRRRARDELEQADEPSQRVIGVLEWAAEKVASGEASA